VFLCGNYVGWLKNCLTCCAQFDELSAPVAQDVEFIFIRLNVLREVRLNNAISNKKLILLILISKGNRMNVSATKYLHMGWYLKSLSKMHEPIG